MAKLKNPLLSSSASGSIGNILTFSKRAKVNQVRYQRGQKDYINDARTTQRSHFKIAVSWWHLLCPDQQAEFDGYDEKDE